MMHPAHARQSLSVTFATFGASSAAKEEVPSSFSILSTRFFFACVYLHGLDAGKRRRDEVRRGGQLHRRHCAPARELHRGRSYCSYLGVLYEHQRQAREQAERRSEEVVRMAQEHYFPWRPEWCERQGESGQSA